MIKIDKIYKRLREDAVSAGGDIGASTGDVMADVGASDGSTWNKADGITTDDVLGDYTPGDGFLGAKNNYVPHKVVKNTYKRKYDIADGGSVKKRKSEYEKGMKIITASTNRPRKRRKRK